MNTAFLNDAMLLIVECSECALNSCFLQ